MANVVLYSLKGGCGKTTTSVILWELLQQRTKEKWGIVSNDVFPKYKQFYDIPENQFKVIAPDEKEIPYISHNIIYDLQGGIDKRIVDLLKQVDLIIIPSLFDYAFIQSQLETLNEVKEFNENLLLLLLKTRQGDLEKQKKVFDKFGIKYPVLELKESKIISNLSNITDDDNEGNRLKVQFKNANKYTKVLLNQLQELENFVMSKMKG